MPSDKVGYVSQFNGRGPRAWNRHWLLVPLHDSAGAVIGMLGADEPEDRLLPSAEKLQALRIFANQAAAAIIASGQVEELRFLADHDPLTRLLNRRAFVDRLDGEVARALRYDRTFALVVCDLDGFKQLNDRFGHAAGDEALQQFATCAAGGAAQGRRRLPDRRRRVRAARCGGDRGGRARGVVRRVTERAGRIRSSFGVAACPADAQDSHTLFRLADAALYEAKRTGSGLQFVA